MKHLGYLITISLVLFFLLNGCTRWRGESNNKGQLIFSHAQHVTQADCTDCHEGVEKSQANTRGQFIPHGHTVCKLCHEDELQKNCNKCHRGVRKGVQFERANRHLKLSHAIHGKYIKTCTTCHPTNQQGGAIIPGHKTCNTASCHKGDYQAYRCQKCHQNLQRYRLKPIAELTHGPDYLQTHGVNARQAISVCTQCHDQTHCAECHARTAMAKPSLVFPEEVDQKFVHRGDYLTRHQIEARHDSRYCMKCHGQYFCRSCHSLNGVAAPTDANLRGGITRNPHPADWLVPGSATSHGAKARQNIVQCASCHDRGAYSVCVKCHRVGGWGGSPHPPGWSWRDKSNQCRHSAMCATCHTGGQGCR